MNIELIKRDIAQDQMPWEDLHNRILQDNIGKRDIQTSSIYMEEDGSLTIDGESGYVLNMDSESQILSRFIPGGIEYIKKCPTFLKAHNLNHWIAQKKGKAYLVRVKSRGERKLVRAILTPRYAPYDNLAVFEEVYRHFKDYVPVGLTMTDTSFHLRLANSQGMDISAKQVGDIVHGGYHISNSETGMGALRFDVIAYRLRCKNGLVSAEETGLQSKVHLGSHDDMTVFFQEAIVDAKDRAEWLLESLKDSHFDRFDPTHGSALVNRLGTRFRWNKPFVFQVQNKLPSEEATKFGLIQAITSAARETLDPDDRLMYERHAGTLLLVNIQRMAEFAYAEASLAITA